MDINHEQLEQLLICINSKMAHGAVGRGVYRLTVDSVFCRITVTVHTPAHRQIRELPHAIHALDRAMAALAW